ncbi:MAG: PAS domain-containing protein, partial [Geminicoccaceae bacterium]|nr:PAS domain-containing protein [Geminicoccaceae bacterium]
MSHSLSFEGAQFDVFVYAPASRLADITKMFERDLATTPIASSKLETLLPEFLTRPLAVIVAILSVIPEKAEKQAAFLMEAAMGRPILALSRNSQALELVREKGIRDAFNDHPAIIEILPRLTSDVVQRLTSASTSLRMLQARRNSEQVVGMLIQQSRRPLAIVGPAGVIRRCSTAFADQFDQPAGELVGKDIDSLAFTEDEELMFDVESGRCVVENEELSIFVKGSALEVGAEISPLPSGIDDPVWLLRLTTPTVSSCNERAGLLGQLKSGMINGTPVSGSLSSIAIAEVRTRMGDRFARLEGTVHQTFQTIMRNSLRAHDSFVQLPSGDYLIAWLGMKREEADRRTREITLKVMDRLFGDTGAPAPPKMPERRAGAQEPPATPSRLRPQRKVEFVSRNAPDLITAVLQERKAAVRNTSERMLNDNLPRVGIRYRPVGLGDTSPTNLVYATPNSAGMEAINAMVHGSMPTELVMRRIDQHMLEIVIDDLSIGTLQPGTQVILDISLSSLARSPARDPILALLQTHAHLTRRQLILNITDFDHSTYEGRIAQAIMVAAPYSALRAASFDATRLRGIAQSSLQAQLLVVDFEDWLQVARQPKT